MSVRADVLTIEEAARLYKGTALTRTALRRLIVTGEIPHRRVSAKYLVTAAAIERWLQGEQAAPIRPVKK